MRVQLRLRKREKEKPWTPRVYWVELTSPTVIELGGTRYECREVRETPSGLLCIQHDGTAVLVQPAQSTTQAKPALL